VPVESVQGILLADLRARRKSVLFCAAAVLRLLIMAGASVWFVQVQKQGVTGVLLGRAIGAGVGVAMLGAISLPFAPPASASPWCEACCLTESLWCGAPWWAWEWTHRAAIC
jgi:hypothetical protein